MHKVFLYAVEDVAHWVRTPPEQSKAWRKPAAKKQQESKD